jgi:hypothetical protein
MTEADAEGTPTKAAQGEHAESVGVTVARPKPPKNSEDWGIP